MKGIRLKEYKGDICYNLACLYSLQNQEKECLKYLERAVKYEAALLAGIDQDTDFDFVRSNSKFKALVNEFKSGKEKKN